MGVPWRNKYESVRRSSEEQALCESEGVQNDVKEAVESLLPWVTTVRRPSWAVVLCATAFNLLLFIVSVALVLWHVIPSRELNASLRKVSTYSPVFDRVDLEMHPVTINGTLFPTDDISLARRPPSPEVDAIWDDWEIGHILPVTAAEIRAMGKDPSTVAKLDDADWHLGDDAYQANFDLFHQLHCLNKLRKIAHSEYYVNDTVEASARPRVWYIHVDHCVDILMQALQCSGNVYLNTLHWTETQRWPFPDMSIRRQCINFDKLHEFRKEASIDMERYLKLGRTKPEGIKEQPIPDIYYELYNVTRPAE